jgi:eukaryotic-like serine/threonine-protein kinase
VTLTTYPSAVDYALALQHPEAAFTDDRLRTARFAGDILGPYGIAGSSAVVFHATLGGDDGEAGAEGEAGEEYALRCYTRQDASTPDRYAALDSFVASKGLGKYVGKVTWYDQQVRVRGARWPVLTMEWIAGRQLNEYAGYLADNRNSAALHTLAGRWLELISELQRASFAHGDLQHGNILVDQSGQLRLVDFDSVWIPPLRGHTPPNEAGHPSYQPLGAAAQSRWGPYMDTFSALAIYLALIALAREPGLWPKFNNGDNLLFERADFAMPLDTSIWTHLAGLGDAEVDRLALKLRECCVPGWQASKTLRDTLKVAWWQGAGQAPGPAARPQAAASGSNATRTTAPTASPRYSPSVPSQPLPPAGSLPPPPAAPYQSTVAPQAGAQPGGAPLPGAGSWWGIQAGSRETAAPRPAATQGAMRPPAPHTVAQNQGSARQVRSAFAVLFIIAAIVVFAALAGHHDFGAGAVAGIALFAAGIGIANAGSKKPPANPPAVGS